MVLVPPMQALHLRAAPLAPGRRNARRIRPPPPPRPTAGPFLPSPTRVDTAHLLCANPPLLHLRWLAPSRLGPRRALGPRPAAPAAPHALTVNSAPAGPATSAPQWDQSALIAALNQLSFQQSSGNGGEWVFDSGASAHMGSGFGITSFPLSHNSPSQIVVGDGSTLPITGIGSLVFPTSHRSLSLHNILISPALIKNLVFPFRSLHIDTPPAPAATDLDMDPPPDPVYVDHAAPPACPAARPCSPPAATAPSMGRGPSSDAPREEPPPPIAAPSSSSAPPPRHHMSTRASHGIVKPNPRYAHLATTPISPLPSSIREAMHDPNWRNAMQEEFDALSSNQTWTLVPRPPRTNVVTGKWVFRHKTREDGSLKRYKARWVVRGFAQRPGIDFGKPSRRLSNRRLSARCSPWRAHATGLCTSWM
ncbi:hypothetical protein QYE76_022462 [Lolium multiflorum]|uniref:Reverse transcriptase Ty1/copia-type domain-containing protein n=1 Tax=Lolium multiflorum TaxID=4521 RepID=A0AAD8RA01_LOLMU|nr:hypothetical protein QYE76_022462 [Lolium multiflorum]